MLRLRGGVQGLVISPAALAHSGHGDEFVQNGEVDQVKASPEQDQLLGITTAAPQSGPDGGLTLPSVAIVDAAGKPLVFVRSGSTYDPVFVRLGRISADRTVVLEGVSADEQVVVSGALSLYAESQKKDRVPVEASPASTAGAKSPQADVEIAQNKRDSLERASQKSSDPKYASKALLGAVQKPPRSGSSRDDALNYSEENPAFEAVARGVGVVTESAADKIPQEMTVIYSISNRNRKRNKDKKKNVFGPNFLDMRSILTKRDGIDRSR